MTYNPEDNQILSQTFIDVITIIESLSGWTHVTQPTYFHIKLCRKCMHPYIYYIHE